MTKQEFALEKIKGGPIEMFTLHKSIMGKFKCGRLDAIGTTTNLLVSGKLKCFIENGKSFGKEGYMTRPEIENFMTQLNVLNEERR